MAKATLTWTANTEADLAGYEVWRGLGSATPTLLVTLGKVTTYTDTTLPDLDQNVTYALKAFDTAGNRSPLSVSVSKVVNAVPPAAPSGLVVVIE